MSAVQKKSPKRKPPRVKPGVNVSTLRLGEWRAKLDAAVARGEYRNFSEAMRLAAATILGEPPILPATRERLDHLARLLGVSSDSALRMLLDRYGKELRPQ